MNVGVLWPWTLDPAGSTVVGGEHAVTGLEPWLVLGKAKPDDGCRPARSRLIESFWFRVSGLRGDPALLVFPVEGEVLRDVTGTEITRHVVFQNQFDDLWREEGKIQHHTDVTD